jgi:DNA polymerase III delta subunit
MKLIIHGEDSVSSRKYLNDKKESYSDVEKIDMDGNKISLSDLVSAADSRSLLGSIKIITIENFFTRSLSKDKETILAYLNGNKTDNLLLFWEQKEIDRNIISKFFSKDEIILCQPPLLLFRFLDSLGINPPKTVLSLFHSLLNQRDAAFIYTMLVRQLRFLIISKDTLGKGITDMSPWQAKKFYDQSRYFQMEELVSLYRKLLQLEYSFKTGLTPYSFSELLDIYFSNI